ncbi:bidirectional sugar transporter SWEET2a [Panicum miliaceum]|uniref:Bidirectional sugar transporter SWEET n=1 Tax=Panicum miliaceum TaxID=4540 RepID=A0A3L6QZE3_PANMI|nr:bidirectional sugar transporter SWEET2a [Panicum miliaceum]
MDWGVPALMNSVGDLSYRHLCCYGAGIAERKPSILLGFLLVFPFWFWNQTPGLGQLLLGSLGNVFAFVLFISPLPTFRRIVRNGSTEQFSAMPYIYSLLNCLICMWYGLPFVSYGVVLVTTVNSIGAAFQLAYTAVFIAFADAKERLKVSGLLAAVFVVFSLIVYVSLALLDHNTRQTFVGYLSVASLIFMFASPLSIILLLGRVSNYSKRDWNHIGYHTAVAVCLLQKRIKGGRQAATASHTYMTVPKNKVHCRSCGNFSGVYSRCFILLLYAWNSEEKLDLSVLNGAMGGL